jgi:hypothetical protein
MPRVIARGTKRSRGPRPATRVSRPQRSAGWHGVLEQHLGPVPRAGRRASVTQTDALSPPRSRSIGTPSAWRRIGGVLFPPCSHPGGAEFGMVPWIWLCRAFSRARPTGFEPVTFGSVDRRSIGRIPHGRAVHRLARHCCITFSALQVIVMSLHVASGAPHRARELLGAAPRRLLRPIENWSTLAG